MHRTHKHHRDLWVLTTAFIALAFGFSYQFGQFLAAPAAVSLFARPNLTELIPSMVFRPFADATYSEWDTSVASSSEGHYTFVDDSRCDGTNTFVSTNTVGARDSYFLNISSIPAGSVIKEIKLIPCASTNITSSSTTDRRESVLDVFYNYNNGQYVSGDSGHYALKGNVPTELKATTFSNLNILHQSIHRTLEVGGVYASGNKGVRLSRIAASIIFVPPTIVAPTKLTASSSTGVRLYWNDNSNNEEAFFVQRSTVGEDFEDIASLAPNTTYYFDPLFISGTYRYRVEAWNRYTGAYSNIVTAIVTGSSTEGISLTAGDTSAEVEIIEGDDNDRATYTIEFEVTAFGEDLYVPFGAISSIAHTDQGVSFDFLNGNNVVVYVPSASTTLSLDSTADVDDDAYVVREGDTEMFILTVDYAPGGSAPVSYKALLQNVYFRLEGIADTDATAQEAFPESDYDTPFVNILNLQSEETSSTSESKSKSSKSESTKEVEEETQKEESTISSKRSE